MRWVPTHSGRNLVRRYGERYGVTKVCAILELRMLGVEIPDARLEQARRYEQDRAVRRARRRRPDARPDTSGDSNETFAFIAGYTEGGAPYGIIWEEIEALDAHTETLPDPSRHRPQRAAGERHSRDGRRIASVLNPPIRPLGEENRARRLVR